MLPYPLSNSFINRFTLPGMFLTITLSAEKAMKERT